MSKKQRTSRTVTIATNSNGEWIRLPPGTVVHQLSPVTAGRLALAMYKMEKDGQDSEKIDLSSFAQEVGPASEFGTLEELVEHVTREL